jgi:YfiH family protein
LAKAGAPEADARLLRQAHGKRISILRSDDDSGVLTQGDGWLTDQPGAVVGVVVADCLPVWIWARSGKAAGVFHAGWRGLEAGILGVAVTEFFRSFSIRPGELEAGVGPHAGACCYRVGDDVARRFRKESLRLRGGEVFLDLGAEARTQLLGAGLRTEAVAVAPDCTICRPGLFYSYRREGGRGPRCGQMLAFLWLEA